MDRQPVAVLRHLDGAVDIREVERGIDALGVHVDRERHDIDIAGALAIAEQRPLDALGARHEGELGGGHARAPVVVRVQAQHDAVAPGEVAVHPLDLVGVDVRRRHLHRRRQVDDHLALRRRLPDFRNRVADVPGVIELGAGEALGRILVDDLGLRHGRRELADQLRPVHGDLRDASAVLAEDHAALERRGGVVEVDDGAARPGDGLEGAPDQLVARLGEHLDGHVVGDLPLVDDVAAEVEIGLAGGREADLDLLEAEAHELLEHAQLPPEAHRLDERLVAVAQIDGAPDGRTGDDGARPAAVGQVDGLEGDVFVSRIGAGHGSEAVLGFRAGPESGGRRGFEFWRCRDSSTAVGLHPPGSRSGPASAGKAEKQNAATFEHGPAYRRAPARLSTVRARSARARSRRDRHEMSCSVMRRVRPLPLRPDGRAGSRAAIAELPAQRHGMSCFPHAEDAYATAVSGMTPPFRTDAPGIPSGFPASVFGMYLSFRPIFVPSSPPPVSRSGGTLIRAYPARAPAPVGERLRRRGSRA